MGKAKRKDWTRTETEAFLHFYGARKSEFNNARKKKWAYINVLKDMIAAGVTGTETTPSHLETKMTTLQRSYKPAKANLIENPLAPCLAPFMRQMEEIFGSETPISKDQSLNVGTLTDRMEPDQDECNDDDTLFLDDWDSCSTKKSRQNTNQEYIDGCPFVDVKPEISDSQITPTESETSASLSAHDSQTNMDASTTNSNLPRKKKIKMTRAFYYQEKLKIKTESEKAKAKRWEEFKAIEKQKMDIILKIFDNSKK